MWFYVIDYCKFVVFHACIGLMWATWVVGLPIGVVNGWLPLWSLLLLVVPITAFIIGWQYEDQNKRGDVYRW